MRQLPKMWDRPPAVPEWVIGSNFAPEWPFCPVSTAYAFEFGGKPTLAKVLNLGKGLV
jgi:hypothetical protein